MKIRKGFVSNSSSASFVVEIKGERERILQAMYENIETFQEESYKQLLERALKWDEERIAKEITDSERKSLNYSIAEYKEELKYLAEYKKPDWDYFLKIEDPKEKDFAIYCEKQHKKKVVFGVLGLKRWCCNYIDDGYISFSDSTIMYNGWEDIAPRKDLLEVLAFFMFMKFEVRTRIECDLQE